jgi:hypothetical protein
MQESQIPMPDIHQPGGIELISGRIQDKTEITHIRSLLMKNGLAEWIFETVRRWWPQMQIQAQVARRPLIARFPILPSQISLWSISKFKLKLLDQGFIEAGIALK